MGQPVPAKPLAATCERAYDVSGRRIRIIPRMDVMAGRQLRPHPLRGQAAGCVGAAACAQRALRLLDATREQEPTVRMLHSALCHEVFLALLRAGLCVPPNPFPWPVACGWHAQRSGLAQHGRGCAAVGMPPDGMSHAALVVHMQQEQERMLGAALTRTA